MLLAVFPVDRIIDFGLVREAVGNPVHDHAQDIVALDEIGDRRRMGMGRGQAHI